MVGEAATLACVPLFRRRTTVQASPSAARPNGRAAMERDWRAYDDVAPEYARVLAPRTAVVARDLLTLLEPKPGWRVLDVGTGTGAFAREAATRDEVRSVAVDASLGMALEAAGDGSGPRYVVATAIDLPFKPGTFDAETAGFVLSHFAKYDTALFDMLRVLKSGGRLGVATWGPGMDEFVRAWQEVAEEFAEVEMLRDARTRAMPWHERFSDPNRLKDALHEAGVRAIQVERREYRFEMTAEDYLTARETAATGRFLRSMLGDEFFERFRTRVREVFAERFSPRFHDYRDVNLAVGTKP
jgi:ubiquinone/menaquinone biosynthesis C-methylase UbiE